MQTFFTSDEFRGVIIEAMTRHENNMLKQKVSMNILLIKK
jgi:hypothetical protein